MTLPYWLRNPHLPQPPLRGDRETDVVLIGAGVCGAAAALALSERGLSTVWLEGRTVSEGATGRNAGFILQGTAERYSRAVSMMGRQKVRAIHQLSRENHLAMAETIATHRIPCEYQRRGSLQLASSEPEERELMESAELLEEDGFTAHLRQGEGLPEVYRRAGFRVGVFLPDDGELDPAAFVRGVASVALARGVSLHEGSPVTHLDASSTGSVVAHTPEGSIRASIALVCTNASAGSLLPALGDKIDPVRGQMLATAPAPPLFACPVYADHGFDYWRQDQHGCVVLGGWRNLDPDGERGFDEVLHPGIQDRMSLFLQRFPDMQGIEITHRWSGIMGFSRDGLPLCGPAPGAPGALVAAGFTGHGFGFAWLCGRALVDLALEGKSEVAERFSTRRFL